MVLGSQMHHRNRGYAMGPTQKFNVLDKRQARVRDGYLIVIKHRHGVVMAHEG